MCVADSKPEDSPAQRAWALWHNAATVHQQAQEARTILENDLSRARHSGEPARVIGQLDSLLAYQREAERQAARAAQTALDAFTQARRYLGITDGELREWRQRARTTSIVNAMGEGV
jgi:hypothetical protein